MFKIKHGFTLAEMMVVMLIMSIILAAMAPVMTTRSKADSSSPWRYSPENLSDAYFGPGESQVAMIGQPNKLETDDAARLILTTSSSLPIHLSFKRDNTTVGRLQFVDTNLVLGSGSMDHLNGGGNNISIGPNNLTQVTSGGSNIAIGDNAMLSTTSGGNNIGIGTTLTGNIDGSNNVAVGDDSLTRANSSWNTVVGRNAYQLGTGGSNTIIGGDAMSEGSGQNNVAVGTNSLWYGSGDGNVAIGANSNYKNQTLTTFTNSTAVGFSSYASGTGSVSLGVNSSSSQSDAISIGNGTTASGESSIAIGSYNSSSGNTTADGNGAISIGDGAVSKEHSVALGTNATANSAGGIAIGKSSEASPKSGYSSFSDGVAIGTNAKVEGTSCGWGPCSYTAGIAIGHDAYTMSSDGIVIGNSASAECNSVSIGYNTTTERHSVAIGHEAKAKDKSVAIGYEACKDVTGSNVVCIGSGSGPTYDMDKSKDHMVYLGTSSDTVYIPGNLVVDGHVILGVNRPSYVFARIANQEVQVNQTAKSVMSLLKSEDWNGDDDNVCKYTPSHLAPETHSFFKEYIGSSWSETKSDRRLKYVGKESQSGLDKIKQLKVFNYTFKKDETKTPHVGVIAQDLQKVFPDAVKKGTDGFLSIRFEDMFFAMINAIKELDLKYQAQETRINELEARIERLEDKILY